MFTVIDLVALAMTAVAFFGAGWFMRDRSANAYIAELEAITEHLQEQNQELQFVVGDAAAAAFVQEEKYQELLDQLFQEKRKA